MDCQYLQQKHAVFDLSNLTLVEGDYVVRFEAKDTTWCAKGKGLLTYDFKVRFGWACGLVVRRGCGTVAAASAC